MDIEEMRKRFNPNKHILDISQWHTPATDYPEKELNSFRIHHSKYYRGMYRNWGLDGHLYINIKKPIPITELQEKRSGKWYDWMIDDPPNYRAMQIYAEYASGKVLTTGLGLGLLLHELAKNPKVTKVTVVEKYPTVIELICPYLPKNLPTHIIYQDFLEFIKTDTEVWDTIIVDIWVTSSKTKETIFLSKIIPLAIFLSQKYPKANITYHGYQSISYTKPVSEEMVKLISDMGGT